MTAARPVALDAEAPRGTSFVATPTPRLTWRTETDASDWTQRSAELEFASAGARRTATIDSSDSVLVPWPFEPLTPGQDGELRVRVTGADHATSDWSEPLTVRAGFLAPGRWHAEPIGLTTPTRPAEPGLVRTEFELPAPVRRATLFATATGAYQVAINGNDVDDQVLKPGWTPYQYRLIHETTDVTALLAEGANAVGIRFAGAWATELYGFRDRAHRVYAEQPSVALQLIVEHTDGTTTELVTDGTWRAGHGPITASGIYAGESYDARLAQPGWSAAGFDDGGWSPARVAEPTIVPEPRTSPPVRRIEEVAVAEVISTPSGRTILDFGQNLVGRLRITVSGQEGRIITLRHAEVLEHGELGVRPLRAAAAADTYTLAGTGEQTWEPEFSFHGFRYAEVAGWPGDLDPASVVAVVIHSDMERTGWFTSSHDLVNRLHENVVWGQRGNFLYLPTDCPQRDERLGWTGDIQVFAPTASFLFDSRTFLSSWLADLALEQRAADGVVPFIVPNVLGPVRPAAAWGDAATVVPSVLLERFADRGTLEAQYESMTAWTDHLLDLAGERHLWEGRFQFGDWLDPTAPPESPADAKAHPDIVASAYMYRSADLVAHAAAVLGHDADARRYRDRAEQVRTAFLAEYVTPAGRMMSDAQTAYALAIVFDIAPATQHGALGRRLAKLVRESGYRIGTGFVGTPIIADALTRTGHLDVATRLLTQTECPSWLYPVTMGATTIWERWDSTLPDGSINPGQMTSFNHYALGAIADWLHRTVAGLAPAEPGYRTLLIQPRPLPGFTHARAEHRTPYGTAAVGWRRDGDTVTVTATVPPNTRARVILPGTGEELTVSSGGHEWSVSVPVAAEPPGPVGLDTSLAAVIDDEQAYATLLRVLGEVSPDAAEDVRAHTTWVPGRSLRERLDHAAGADAADRVAEAYAELSAGRGH
ncbi:family 78 glycoside hydrolase catalytic domain [Occultella aeris]|uniref:alpha-L-rhamnosidase n=1 Tax=Occultella aeris TaxID=2761496 RepID=A0A7M4DI48_9MICO|nr:family 78 glycoside hydrolase catalytic domain [Occultella aeris]VZO36612.1 Bacterial alpha-L-rhamnosidase [Occultella aeris]